MQRRQSMTKLKTLLVPLVLIAFFASQSYTNINKTEKEIFNRADSIKTIQLSTGDTIIISKNYGIFRFDDIFENNKYSLVGINNLLGDSVPDFFDFFDFFTTSLSGSKLFGVAIDISTPESAAP